MISEWDALSSGFALSGDWCEPGDIIDANGKEFVISENRTIEVKYGDDIPGLYPMKVVGHIEEATKHESKS